MGHTLGKGRPPDEVSVERIPEGNIRRHPHRRNLYSSAAEEPGTLGDFLRKDCAAK